MNRLIVLLALLLGLASVGCGSDEPGGLFAGDQSQATADYSFLIPAGSGEAIDRGDPLDILPLEMNVTVGEVIEIINQDDRGHLIGPFFVGKGETIRQRFTATGTFIGDCTVHPSGQITLHVSE